MEDTYRNSTELVREQRYVQSANSLFHFMSEERFLFSSIDKQALFPRYCPENIDYLQLQINGKTLKTIYVLQKCFCDIPLHQLSRTFKAEIIEAKDLDAEKLERFNKGTHASFYGEYAIAFSKTWSINNNLQPVHYINPRTSYTAEFKNAFEHLFSLDSLSEVLFDDIISRLALIKPLSGEMVRRIDGQNVLLRKNFHDEREWRYIPSSQILHENNLERIVYKPLIFNDINGINDRLENDIYKEIFLKYQYSDIKYLIVPDKSARQRLIEHIINLPDELFGGTGDTNNEKMLLISKVLVIEELEEDL